MERYVLGIATVLLLTVCSSKGLENRYGKVSINKTDSRICRHVTYSKAFQQSTGVKIQLSLGHGLKFIRVHNPSALWATAITALGFVVCLRELGPQFNDTTTVHWLAIRGTDRNLEQGEVIFPEFSVGTNCKTVQPTGKYSSTPRVFVSIVGPNQKPHNSAHYAWVETGSWPTFRICLFESVVFDGSHSGIKAVWFAFDENKHPWNHTSQLNFDSRAVPNGQTNYAMCQVVNFTNPYYAPPVVLLTAYRHRNKSTSTPTKCNVTRVSSAWTEDVTKMSFRACAKSLPIEVTIDQSLGTNYIVLGDLNPCLGITCDYFAECRAFGPHDARCVCVTTCPSYEESVCSSNGTTFRNKCFFQLEMCRLKNNHTITHPGSCRGFPWQRGRALIVSNTKDDTTCTAQRFDNLTFYPDKGVHVQLTVNHANTSNRNYVHDAMATWAENINFRGFDVCVTTAGRNSRARVSMANVDWFAYQGAPPGGVTDRTRISGWWTGTKCQTIQLPRGSFQAAPIVLLTAEHISQGSLHDAATLWAEDITPTSFKACLRELQNFDGFHQDIHVNWLAFYKIHRPLFTEKGKVFFPNTGQPSLQSNGAFCKDLKYIRPYGHVPTIVLSTSHKSSVGSVSPECNGVSSWIEYINTSGFRICVKELYVNKYEPLTVNYLLLFDICTRGWNYFEGLCYQTSPTCRAWTAAESACRADGAFLATVKNQEENVYVQQQLNGEKGWIGLNDRSIEGDFRWSSKMSVNWTYWATRQPNDYDSTQDCVHTLGPLYGYHWNDIDCATCNNYTCTKDFDECGTDRHSCHSNATCANTYGSYTCTCETGFTGDGHNCTDIDECARGRHSCHSNATCSNTLGSHACTCKSGFTGNGHNCTDVDECAIDRHRCHDNATCNNTYGSYTCACKPGFQGNGHACKANEIPLLASLPNIVYTSTSHYSRSHKPEYVSMSDSRGNWATNSAGLQNPNEYVQIDLMSLFTVSAIATKGNNGGEWTTSYKIEHSTDNSTWMFYQQRGYLKVFTGNTDGRTSVKHLLSPPITARVFRFYPIAYHSWKSMQVELYGSGSV